MIVIMIMMMSLTACSVAFGIDQVKRAMKAEERVETLELSLMQHRIRAQQYFTMYLTLRSSFKHSAAPADWRSVMGFDASESVTAVKLNERYKKLALVFHPDSGGSTSAMTSLNVAKTQADREIKK